MPSIECSTFSFSSRFSVFDTLVSLIWLQIMEILPSNWGALEMSPHPDSHLLINANSTLSSFGSLRISGISRWSWTMNMNDSLPVSSCYLDRSGYSVQRVLSSISRPYRNTSCLLLLMKAWIHAFLCYRLGTTAMRRIGKALFRYTNVLSRNAVLAKPEKEQCAYPWRLPLCIACE